MAQFDLLKGLFGLLPTPYTEDLEAFYYPNVDNFTDDHMAGQVEAIHAAGKAA